MASLSFFSALQPCAVAAAWIGPLTAYPQAVRGKQGFPTGSQACRGRVGEQAMNSGAG